MDRYSFIIALLDKTIWPITLFISLFIIRKPLKELVPFLKKAKFKDLELEFEKELNNVSQQAANEFPDFEDNWRNHLIILANNYPNQAVLEAWKEIEQRAYRLIINNNPAINLSKTTPYKQMEEILTSKNLVETRKTKVFKDLRLLRNKVAHARQFSVTPEQAVAFITIAISFAEYLDEKISNTHC
ncbi:hypothetical protein DMA11_13505 [Marinilabiliaceae bacterium JC017]|nr:hypothetical protein DMA11_13505 [Marinilabiliaceae bacterium JC017]